MAFEIEQPGDGKVAHDLWRRGLLGILGPGLITGASDDRDLLASSAKRRRRI